MIYDIWVALGPKSGGSLLAAANRLGVCGDAYDVIVFIVASATAMTLVDRVEP